MIAGENWVKLSKESATQFYTPPPLEGKIAMDTLTPFPAPVVYKTSGPMGEGILYTTGAEAENSAVNFSKESVPPLYKNRSSKEWGKNRYVIGWKLPWRFLSFRLAT